MAVVERSCTWKALSYRKTVNSVPDN